MSADDRSILLVEDNPMDVDPILRACTRRRVTNTIHVARDGEEAQAWLPRWAAGKQRPAVVPLDLKLPKVDGLEVLRQLKQHPAPCVIPVVVLTTSSQSADLRAVVNQPAN